MAKHTKRSSKRSTKRSHRNKRSSKHRGGEDPNVPVNNASVEEPNAAGPAANNVVANAAAANNASTEVGGRRKTRKASKGISDWNKKVMMVYHEMKKKDSSVKLGAAMKECSKRKKRGEL